MPTKYFPSTVLFNSPSFWKGVARTMDTYSELDQYNLSLTGEEADSLALWRDWKMVGEGICQAIIEYERTHPRFRQRNG